MTTTAQKLLAEATELEARADLLHAALLAPSMKEDALRDKAAELRAALRLEIYGDADAWSYLQES